MAAKKSKTPTLEVRLGPVEASLPQWLVWIGGAALLVLLGGRGIKSLALNYRDFREARTELSRLRDEHSELEARLRKFRRDDGYLERVARRELGMTRAGEFEYRFDRP